MTSIFRHPHLNSRPTSVGFGTLGGSSTLFNDGARARRRPEWGVEIRAKTDGRCHICGGHLGDDWAADHVLPHAGGGAHSAANYLPAHTLCNGYRWNYSAEELQWIMKIGIWARKQMEDSSRLGSEMVQQFYDYEVRRQQRRKRHAQALR